MPDDCDDDEGEALSRLVLRAKRVIFTTKQKTFFDVPQCKRKF